MKRIKDRLETAYLNWRIKFLVNRTADDTQMIRVLKKRRWNIRQGDILPANGISPRAKGASAELDDKEPTKQVVPTYYKYDDKGEVL